MSIVGGMRATEGSDSLGGFLPMDSRRKNVLPQLVSVTALAAALGTSVTFARGLPYTWFIAITAFVCFLTFSAIVGSLRAALEALLIFSLSMQMDVNLGYTEKYQHVVQGIPITLSGLILICLYMLWALRLYHRTDCVRFCPLISIPFALIVLWSAFSALWAAKAEYTFYRLWGMVEMFLLVLYAANMVKSQSDIRFLVTCMAITLGLSAVIANAQCATGSSFGLEFLGAADAWEREHDLAYVGTSRAAGFMRNGNSFAFFMKLWLPLMLLWMLARWDSLARRILCLVSFGLGLVALVLSYSRGGWLAFAFSLILTGVWLNTRRSRQMLGGVLPRFLLLGMASLVFVAPFAPRILNRLTLDDFGAAYSRIPLAKVACNIICRHPLTGVGMGNYQYVMHKYDSTPEQITREPEGLAVHNIYLMLGAELGVVALAFFLAICFFVFRAGVRTLRCMDGSVALFTLGLLVGLAAFCLHGMLEPGGIGYWKFRPFWLMSGLVFASSQMRGYTWTSRPLEGM